MWRRPSLTLSTVDRYRAKEDARVGHVRSSTASEILPPNWAGAMLVICDARFDYLPVTCSSISMMGSR
jgi:hypothetical protein